MKDDYSTSTTLRCITCGDSNFSINDDRSWAKCNRCEKEYVGGYDELVELNQATIEEQIELMKQEVAKDAQAYLRDMFKSAFKNKGNIRLK